MRRSTVRAKPDMDLGGNTRPACINNTGWAPCHFRSLERSAARGPNSVGRDDTAGRNVPTTTGRTDRPEPAATPPADDCLGESSREAPHPEGASNGPESSRGRSRATCTVRSLLGQLAFGAFPFELVWGIELCQPGQTRATHQLSTTNSTRRAIGRWSRAWTPGATVEWMDGRTLAQGL